MAKVLIDTALINEVIDALPDELGKSHFALRTKLRQALVREDDLEIMETALNEWVATVTAVDTEVNKLVDVLHIDPECPLFASIWHLQDAYTQEISNKFGLSDWLYWFQYDNEMGKKGMEAGIAGDMRPIKTVEDLIWVAKLEAR